MTKTIQISVETRSAIITLRKKDYYLRDIAYKLKISYKGVQRRSRITSKAEDIRIQIICKLNRRLTASQIRADLNHSSSTPVPLTTVKRRLRAGGLNGYIAVGKPLLSLKKSQNAV
ncbi:uncharacterized protein LOC122537356 [Frieseomelitta varia]|uniref:uncharacterized protein LOC122537356 n=1 Tax=Frieseomelitta varia TaxID=561572 RepID=UPI001CB67EA1|nr:uncharacterized protein LOC122537356 [Frieseomelitta varia]